MSARIHDSIIDLEHFIVEVDLSLYAIGLKFHSVKWKGFTATVVSEGVFVEDGGVFNFDVAKGIRLLFWRDYTAQVKVVQNQG